ncbi:murein hydrolase transporter LrgA, partial [Bacillus sp. AFS075960]
MNRPTAVPARPAGAVHAGRIALQAAALGVLWLA